MARTLRGKLTGRAASAELRDQREYLVEMAEKHSAEMKGRFEQALAELQAADPRGWEAWYDDDQNVPDWDGWENCGPAMEAIQKRVEEVRGAKVAEAPKAPEAPKATEEFNWKVASANTLRVYGAAAKDFETATQTRVDRADSASMQRWHEGMKLRGLSSNTIRVRIAAMRILSGVQYPLPAKETAEESRQKAEGRLLSLAQVQAVLRQAQGEERSALVLALTVGPGMWQAAARPSDFRAYFLGAGRKMTAQSMTRLIKRCARKAGVDARLASLRTWTRSGAALLKALSPAEFARALPQADLPESVDWTKQLHGIGRRSRHFPKA